MTMTVGIILQIVGFVLHGILTQTTLLAGEWGTVAHIVVAGIQVVLAGTAFNSNPDGTPSTTAYVPPTPKKPYLGWTRSK